MSCYIKQNMYLFLCILLFLFIEVKFTASEDQSVDITMELEGISRKTRAIK